MAKAPDDPRGPAEDADAHDGATPPPGETPEARDEGADAHDDATPPSGETPEPRDEDGAGEDDGYGRPEQVGEGGESHPVENGQDEDPHAHGPDEGSEDYDYGEYDQDYAYEQDHDHGEYDDEEYEEYDEDEEEFEEDEEEEEEEEEDGQRKMTLVEHLEELRLRIIRAAIGLAVAMGLSLYFTTDIIRYLNRTLNELASELADKTGRGVGGVIEIDLTAGFMTYLKMSLYLGIIVASPWLFYQAWMFVAAGLYKHERKYVKIAVPFCSVLFVGGAAFFLVIISKFIIGFFFWFSYEKLGVVPQITLKNHITFMTNMMLVFGLCFQMPVAVFILGKMGLVTTRTLNHYRKYVVVAIFIIAAFCTSPSPLDQIALAIPMWMLYELGVLLVYLFVEKKRREEEAAEEDEEPEAAEGDEEPEDAEEDEEPEGAEDDEDEGSEPADDGEDEHVEPMH